MDKKEKKDKCEMTASKLKNLFDTAKTYYSAAQRKMDLLDQVDRGDFWKALKGKFPCYQILVDTNYVNYVKSNLLASVYTVTKSAEVMPTSEEDKELVTNINIALDNIWELSNVGYYQYQAGERAALLNLGITQVGWDDNIVCGKGSNFTKGNIVLKNIDPMKFMRDPFAVDLDSSAYCMTYDIYHKSVLLKNKNYTEAFKAYLEKQKSSLEQIPMLTVEKQRQSNQNNDNYTLFIYWVREGDKINEYHCINNECIIYKKEDIQPSCFPFALLYCELPAGALIGSSPASKILANSIAYNVMDSLIFTAEYKNQRPPKFINASSGINIQDFIKHGEEADRTYIVNGDASKAVHYHQFPNISNSIPNLKLNLAQNIETVSGVDGRYTGRDTGSIITTGGTEEMLNRVTLIDTPKIMNYENYTKRLTQLILSNFIEFSPKRKYFYKKLNSTTWETKEVDFPKIDSDTLFNYKIIISSELPKNKQRIAAMANMLMEKQMQYAQQGNTVQLITEEEWLMFQDIPNKEYMLERMGIQRLQNEVDDAAFTLSEYANLVGAGMSSEDALIATAQGLKDKHAGNAPEGTLTAGMQAAPQAEANGNVAEMKGDLDI